MNRSRKKMCSVFLTVLLSFVLLLVFAACEMDGCFYMPKSAQNTIEFYRSKLTIVLDDERVIAKDDFVYTYESGDFPDGTLTSGSSSVLNVSGMTVTGRKIGRTTLTYQTDDGKRTTCTVEVVNDIETVSLYTKAPAANLNSCAYISVHTVLNEGHAAASKYAVNWKIDGLPVIGADGTPFTGSVLTVPAPTEAAAYEIIASVTSKADIKSSAPLTVVFYEPFDEDPTLSVLESKGAYDYTLRFAGGEQNEDIEPIIEWFVNDEPVASAKDDALKLIYKPDSPGVHRVSARVNGIPATHNGEQYDEVTVKGAVTPVIDDVDFDSAYPDILVKFTGGDVSETFRLSVRDRSNTVVYTTDVTGKFVCTVPADKMDIFGNEYRFSVASLGDNGANSKVFTPSASSETMKLLKLPNAAKSYLEGFTAQNPQLNRYVRSDDEFFELFDHYMLYRAQPVEGKTSVSFKVYMGYTPDRSFERLYAEALNRANYAGKYGLGGKYTDNIAEVNIDFYTVSEPSTYSQGLKAADAAGAFLPTVANNIPLPGAKLPIDSIKQTVAVKTTDQLYRAAENGYKPVVEKDSAAERVYAYARELLLTVLDEDMTDAERACAIYDWIMWKVSYDTDVLDVSEINESVKYASFYIEGILNEDAVEKGMPTYAVCDGISKTYSLLCNMAGLPAMRVTGKAVQDGKTDAHAWNKVRIDGEWYIVDCTWGDMTGGTEMPKELATHLYFLKTDAEMPTHTESEHIAYPRTALIPYEHYARKVYGTGDGAFSAFVYTDSIESEQALVTKIVAYLTAQKQATNGIAFKTYGGATESKCTGVELMIADRVLDMAARLTDSGKNGLLHRALSASGAFVKAYLRAHQNAVFIIVSWA